MWTDLKCFLRAFVNRPGFLLLPAGVLACGIACSAALFAFVNALLFRPPAVSAPGDLTYLSSNSRRLGPMDLGYDDYLTLRGMHGPFVDLAGYGRNSAAFTFGRDDGRLVGEMVTSHYFAVLGVSPLLGRALLDADCDSAIGDHNIVISYGLWQGRLAAMPQVIGSTIYLDGEGYVIVGVMRPGFRGMLGPWIESDYWVPMLPRAAQLIRTTRYDLRFFASMTIVARRIPSVGIRDARQVVREWGRAMKSQRARAADDWSLEASPRPRSSLPFDVTGRVVPERLAVALMAVGAMVLLIAVANVAGLLGARALSQEREVGVRVALGAGPWQVARPVLIEAAFLAGLGGSAGLFLTKQVLNVGRAALPAEWNGTHVAFDLPLDLHVLLFALAACLAVGVLIGIGRLLHSRRVDVVTVLAGGTGSTPRRLLLGRLVVIPQLCLSFALLVPAGALVRTLLESERMGMGFVPEKRVFLRCDVPRHIAVPKTSVADGTERPSSVFAARVLEAAQRVEQLESVAISSALPFDNMQGWTAVRSGDRRSHRWAARADVSPGYFGTMGITLLRGRDFDGRDTSRSAPVAIVSEAFARLSWPGKDPIGERVAFHEPDDPQMPVWREVVGIVREVFPPLSDGRVRPAVYLPLTQGSFALVVVAKTRGHPGEALNVLRAVVKEASMGAVTLTLRAGGGGMPEVVASMTYPRRATAAILASSGLMGLLLASVGLFGVVAFSAQKRQREIGIRAAVGAQAPDIVRLIVAGGIPLLAVGSFLGVLLSLAATRLTASTVVAVPAMDFATYASIAVFTSGVTGLACYLPARRASRLDPAVVLRES